MKNPFCDAKIVSMNTKLTDYHRQSVKRGSRDFVMSKSELFLLSKCPSKWIKGATTEDTDSTEWGTLVETLLFENGEFERNYAIVPETYVNDKGETKEWNFNANICKDWKVKNVGKIAIKKPELEDARIAVKNLDDDQILGPLIRASQKQVWLSAMYYDKDTDLEIPVKCLIDLVPHKSQKCLADLKTTRDAGPFNFKWQAFRCGYHWQGAMYLDMYQAAKPDEDRVDFRLILSENVTPYEIGRRTFSSDMIALGRAGYLAALKTYCWCIKTGFWPTFDDEARSLDGAWGIIAPEARMIENPAEYAWPSDNEPERESTEQFDIVP